MLSTLGDGWKMTQVTYTQHMFLLPCDFIWRQFLTHVSCPISVPPPHAPPLPSPSPSPAIPSQLVNIGSQYSYSSQDQSEFLVVVSKEFNNPLPGSDTKPTDKEKVSVLTMCSHLLLSPPVPKGFKTAWLQDVNLTTETVFVCCFITSFIVHKDDHACMHVHMCSAHQAFHGTVWKMGGQLSIIIDGGVGQCTTTTPHQNTSCTCSHNTLHIHYTCSHNRVCMWWPHFLKIYKSSTDKEQTPCMDQEWW